MVGEEDKLDNLCKLLDRLDGAYGKNSPSNSPLKVKKQNEISNLNGHKKFDSPAKNSLNNVSPAKNSVCDSPAKKSTKNSPVKRALEPKNSSNAADNEANLTQEEKLALRKAKKEAKKMGKQQKSQSDTKENLMDPSNLSLKTSPNLNDSNNISSIEDKKQEKSKADLKRERREKQEAQRASKEATKVAATAVAKSPVASNAKTELEKEGNMIKKGPAKKKENLSLERHLPLLEHLSTHKSVQHELPLNSSTIHPAIRAMSLSMKDLFIDGCIARVVATLSAIYHLIEDYQTPPSCDLSRDLSSKLNNNVAFLNACRPISEPMNNAIRFVKREVNKVDSSVPERRAKEDLLEAIQTYIHQNIVLASQAIIQNTLQFIEDNDVILTFGFSSLVYETVEAASKKCENLCVIVADNQGCPSGVDMLPLLIDLGVKVLYRVMPDLSQIIKKVTKVVVEAEAVVLNGAMIGRCGLSGTILLAASHSLPVIALSHTFKFCNIDLTDSLVVNELGSPAPIVDCPSSTYKQTLAQWKDTSSLNLVNLVYDVTPPRLISILVTERNAFPTSVVPVIIKRNYADILGQD